MSTNKNLLWSVLLMTSCHLLFGHILLAQEIEILDVNEGTNFGNVRCINITHIFSLDVEIDTALLYNELASSGFNNERDTYGDPENPLWRRGKGFEVELTAGRHSFTYGIIKWKNNDFYWITSGGLNINKSQYTKHTLSYKFTKGMKVTDGQFLSPIYVGSDFVYDYYRMGTTRESNANYWFFNAGFTYNKFDFSGLTWDMDPQSFSNEFKSTDFFLGVGETYIAYVESFPPLSTRGDGRLRFGYNSSSGSYYRVDGKFGIGIFLFPSSSFLRHFNLLFNYNMSLGNSIRGKIIDIIESGYSVTFAYIGIPKL